MLTNIASHKCVNYIKHLWPSQKHNDDVYYAQIPAVYYHNNCYHILYADRSQEVNKSFISYIILDQDFQLTYQMPTPFYQPNRVGFFDSDGAMPSQFIHIDNELYLTFNGWNALSNCYLNSVGLIKINFHNNKMQFSEVAPTPFLGRNIDNPSSAVVPWMSSDQKGHHVIFIGTDSWVEVNKKYEPMYYLKYATGANLETLRVQNHKLLNDFYENEVYSRPSTFEIDNTLILAFCSRLINDFRDGENSYKIQFATAKSGEFENWDRKKFVFAPDLEWCDAQTSYPYFLDKGGNELLMFFNGNSFGRTGFGVASFDKQKLLTLLMET